MAPAAAAMELESPFTLSLHNYMSFAYLNISYAYSFDNNGISIWPNKIDTCDIFATYFNFSLLFVYILYAIGCGKKRLPKFA